MALCALLTLSACALAAESPAVVRVAMVSPADLQLYPLRVMDRDAVSMLDLVYESLVTINDDREPEPNLATSWTASEDGKTWIFTIRDDVFFHDGRTLTAYDVKATLDAIAVIAAEDRPNNEKGLYSLVPNVVASAQADDDRTLRVRTDKPSYALLYAMTFPVLQAQSVYDANPPGTGPYRIDYYVPGKELWLVGNENWWQQTPHVREIAGIWYATAEDALRAFEVEDVDVLMTRSKSATRYRGTMTSRTNSYDFSTQQLEILMINNYVSSLRDVRMRQAIAHAINISRLKANIYQSLAIETNSLVTPGSWLYNEDIPTYKYDPEEAMKLLNELGWTLVDSNGFRYKKTDAGDVYLQYRLLYYDEAGNAMRKEAANEIKTMLEAVGIKVGIHTYTLDNGRAKLKSGDYDLFLCAYNFDITPDPYFILHSDRANDNFAAYRSEEMNALCAALRKAVTRDDFKQVWYQIQQLFHKEQPFLPLYWREGVVLTRYPYSTVRDIREFELLTGIEKYR